MLFIMFLCLVSFVEKFLTVEKVQMVVVSADVFSRSVPINGNSRHFII